MPPKILIDRYRLSDELARGGMAAVWRATDEVLERTVAVKILHEHIAADESLRERFRIEALAAARLSHPNIVAVFDTGVDEGFYFIVMEYLPGGTLRDLVDQQGPLDPDQVATIGADVCAALSYAHSSDVIHRDIKPANILFSETQAVKVGDFGIAKAAFAPAELTGTGIMLGTMRYLAPEQVQGVEPDGRADLYSLGVVLYEAVTGRAAFSGETDIAMATARLGPPPRAPRDLRPEVPRYLDAAIMRALSVDRDQRFRDADEFAHALTSGGDRTAQTVRPAIGKTAPGRAPGRTPGDDTTEVPGFIKSERGWLARALLIFAIAGAVVYAAVSGVFERLFEELAPASADTEIPIVAGGTYDPDPGDGSENDSRVPRVFDKDPATAWNTASYRRADLGGLKEGVGIWIDLGEATDIERIEVDSVTGGWKASLRTSRDGTNWTAPGLSVTADTRESFDAGSNNRYWMIWITELVQTEGHGTSSRPFSVAISEIRAIS